MIVGALERVSIARHACSFQFSYLIYFLLRPVTGCLVIMPLVYIDI